MTDHAGHDRLDGHRLTDPAGRRATALDLRNQSEFVILDRNCQVVHGEAVIVGIAAGNAETQCTQMRAILIDRIIDRPHGDRCRIGIGQYDIDRGREVDAIGADFRLPVRRVDRHGDIRGRFRCQ